MLPEKDDKAETMEQKDTDEVKISFKNYSSIYPGNEKASLIDVNLELKESQLLGVIGPVGAGKSTLLNTVRVFTGIIASATLAQEMSPILRSLQNLVRS